MAFEENGIKFYLYGDSSAQEKSTKIVDMDSNRYNINPKNPVKILCHGWLDDKKSYWYQPTVQAYITMGDVNIITVHWGKYAKSCYGNAVRAVSTVGHDLSLLIIKISEQYGIPFNRFHILGHSLGAHIAGYAGKFIITSYNIKIGRITGLDPARPGFKKKGAAERLCPEDATFVDVIHTNAGHAGFDEPIGQIDFYPNGGNGGFCESNHKRAPLLFAESINSLKFVAVGCDSYEDMLAKKFSTDRQTIMGEHVEMGKIKGIFYLKTNTKVPFALGNIYEENK